jgi:hypothetical protein
MPCERLALPLLLTVVVGANAAHAARPTAAAGAPVSAELLEFLGGFETSGGKPVDPLWFLDNGKPKTAADPNPAPAAKSPGGTPQPEGKP